ncbi:SO2930 family diheme c-type cytochrome [Algoriphagus persicinus]|uniref:SO2930 family diheme c-type cytochrome n=1 Tax=Algoriphagus persicinus TaxID=3108754 RepID=UPI002B398387|nr:SO2930 family diheme c-type cytochrome [Algoriphagus sp. E1-3-M2]MEB2784834.1 SO2930 family diheme c-type cytochrome [Algoriphagus sp. E1-3-M2]
MRTSKIFCGVNLLLALVIFTFACKKETTSSQAIETILEDELADGVFPYKRLSTYGFFAGELNKLNPVEAVIPYQPASSLFTDYALKSRFIFSPEGLKATLTSNELDFPKGTVLIKNFYYPADFRKPESERRIIETRLLINSEKGWEAFPYIWNESQTEAVLKVVGGETEVSFTDYNGKDQVINYIIPNKNQCKTCHNKSEVLAPIGVKVQHLNNVLEFSSGKANQLAHWTALGKLEGFVGEKAHPSMINYEDKSLPLDERAMAYLDINCGHCHSEEGPASTSGLFLTYDQTDPKKLGVNKIPVAAGNGAGTFDFDIVAGKADESILTHRMNSTEVGIAMPELGRTTVHKEGVQLIRDWINGMN